MKLAVFCCLLALLGCAAASRFDRSLKGKGGAFVGTSFTAESGSDSSGSDAGSYSDAYVAGFGKSTDGAVSVYGDAYGESYALAVSEAKEALAIVYADATSAKYVEAKAKAEASAFAKTFAAAVVQTEVNVQSAGDGAEGCAGAVAVAKAAAKAFAAVFVEAVTAIKTSYGYDHIKVSTAYDYALLFSEVETISKVEVCAEGYAEATAAQESVAAAAAEAALYAFAKSASKSYYDGIGGKTSGSTGGSHEVKDKEYAEGSGFVYIRTDSPGYADGKSQGGAYGDSLTVEDCYFTDYDYCCRDYYAKGCVWTQYNGYEVVQMDDENLCKCT